MRGGTSRALFLMENHLPKDYTIRDKLILDLFGSPDPYKRQIDGLGGAVSSTSKVAIIGPSKDPQYDVTYNFGQVSIDHPIVDYRGNCGNISSAVGPFAIDQGLVQVEEPITKVRIHQLNTDKLIVAHVPVKEGRFTHEGEYEINGVPGKGSQIDLHFYNPAGSVTGKLLPTDNPIETIDVPHFGTIEFSLIDAANPYVFVKASDFNLTGTEISQIDQSIKIKEALEFVRCQAAVLCGLVATREEAGIISQAIPKIMMIAPAQPYTTIKKDHIRKNDIDIVIRMISMGTLHTAIAMTGAICCAGAAKIPGTILSENTRDSRGPLLIGSPSGVIDVRANVINDGKKLKYIDAMISRTARRIMEGYAFVSNQHFLAC